MAWRFFSMRMETCVGHEALCLLQETVHEAEIVEHQAVVSIDEGTLDGFLHDAFAVRAHFLPLFGEAHALPDDLGVVLASVPSSTAQSLSAESVLQRQEKAKAFENLSLSPS
jgi:hypothetical protein